MSASPITRPRKASELLADHFRERIVRGHLAEGDALPTENELMESLEVSRPTLREAFRVLESEGLLEIRRGSIGGATVRAPDPTGAARATGLVLQHRNVTLADVYRARLIIEPPAAALLAETAGPESLAHLQTLLEEEGACVDDPEAYGHASARFHAAVLAECGNQTIAVLSLMMADIVDRHTRIVVSSSDRGDDHAGDLRASHRSHEKLVRLIEAGGPAEAEAYWRTHLEALGSWLVDGGRGEKLIELFD